MLQRHAIITNGARSHPPQQRAVDMVLSLIE